MKQIIIGQNKAYATGVDYKDLTKVAEGVIGIFNLADCSLISTREAFLKASSVAIVCGRGTDKMPINFPEVDIKSLSIEKASFEAATKFTASITVPTPIVDKDYTIMLAKCGVVFNERNTWTYTCRAKTTIAANVATEIVKAINANTICSGLKATSAAGKITVTAVDEGVNFNLIGADELTGVAVTDVTVGKKGILDKAYVQDMASRCASEKGFNDVLIDGISILPGYPEAVDADKYVMYTLRFAVPRVAAKQRDEVVWQLVHICVPVGSGAVTTLDKIFGYSTTA